MVECRNAACECAFVVAEVKRRSQALRAGGGGAGGAELVETHLPLKLGEMAVLARTNATLEGMKEAFRAAGVP